MDFERGRERVEESEEEFESSFLVDLGVCSRFLQWKEAAVAVDTEEGELEEGGAVMVVVVEGVIKAGMAEEMEGEVEEVEEREEEAVMVAGHSSTTISHNSSNSSNDSRIRIGVSKRVLIHGIVPLLPEYGAPERLLRLHLRPGRPRTSLPLLV